ncbi:hypothetical protein HDU81_001024 [Chytriomyces hyalinus]|nr:hypothetical protein HDU81_001024 [Chytriomyces hyalinus]
MDKNQNLSLPASQHYTTLDFIPSPTAGVLRGMLDRKGNEKARATTLVRYEPNKSFPPHVHTGGEEFLVLEGVFRDHEGSYPAGTYVRHPVGSSHAPWVEEEGCLILVKLQFMPVEDPLVVVRDAVELTGDQSTRHLFQSDKEVVSVVSLSAGGSLSDLIGGARGIEVFVLAGSVLFEGQEYSKYGWIRLPPNSSTPISSTNGAKLFVKSNHLAHHLESQQ